jgi:hypothetical protein
MLLSETEKMSHSSNIFNTKGIQTLPSMPYSIKARGTPIIFVSLLPNKTI